LAKREADHKVAVRKMAKNLAEREAAVEERILEAEGYSIVNRPAGTYDGQD